jgi:hypothetical protein
MQMPNSGTTTPAVPGWLSGRRGFVIAAIAAAVPTAFALGQHWLTVADLVPLLFVLPCAAMMLKCLKGANGNPRPDTPQASAQSDRPVDTDIRVPAQPEPLHWSG